MENNNEPLPIEIALTARFQRDLQKLAKRYKIQLSR